jgi:hypothetical protein
MVGEAATAKTLSSAAVSWKLATMKLDRMQKKVAREVLQDAP